MYTFLVFILFTFASCASNRPVATTHTERIETHLQPIPVGTDTIEITEYRLQSTDNRLQSTDTPYSLLPTPYSIKSTRGVNISRHETDTTSMLRITLQPDTVFVPYTNHIRSDTIVVHDRICNEKLKQTKFMNVILLILLILFVATIIYRKIFHK